MTRTGNSRQLMTLIVGDLTILGLVTIFGFASHQTLDSAGLRMLTTFVPVTLGWLMTAPFLGAYHPTQAAELRQVWRPFYAMVLAGPMAAWMRGAWLNAPILPIFVVVLGGVSALAILAWRLLYILVIHRRLG